MGCRRFGGRVEGRGCGKITSPHEPCFFPYLQGVWKNELFKRDPPLPLEGGVKGSRGREAPPGPEAREATASRPSARVLFQRGRRSGPPPALRCASFFPSPGRARGALPGEEKPPRRGTA